MKAIFTKFLAGIVSLFVAVGTVSAANPTNTASAAAAPVADSDSYKLVPMDKLYFKIDQDPVGGGVSDLALLVTPQGVLEVPVSRGYDLRLYIQAVGRTIGDVKKEIKEKLEGQYYKSATVTLMLVSQSVKPGQVMFYGEIKGPMALIPGQPRYLSDAVIEMKPSDYANLSRVKLLRVDPVTKATVKREFDVDQILSTGKRDKDVLLQDGDIINVPAKIFNFK